jgi:glycosyltransferase involved in cell wall biosynthesis
MDALISEGHPLAAGLTLDILCPAKAVKVSPFVNIRLRSLPDAPGHLWEQLIVPRYVRGGLLSLCNSGPLAVKRHIVCIHDMNIRLSPESYNFSFRTMYRVLQPALGWRAARIATVSRFSQKTIAEFGIRPANEIEVIYNGHEHVLAWKADRCALLGSDMPRPFVLLIGSKAPHKNLTVIYSIAADLAAKGIDVLVAGGEDARVYASEHGGQPPPNVKHLGRVEDNDLAFLYQNALCLAFPSRTEGFGLPALEAMALGCPVISSNATSLPEVCGEAALYAPPNDGAAWLVAIGEFAVDPILRQRLASAGQERAKLYSWRQGAEQYLELMMALDRDAREHGKAE